MGINFDPNPADNTIVTVVGVAMNIPKPISIVGGVITDGVQENSSNFNFPSMPSSQFYVRNAGQPGGAAYEALADVANSQDSQGKVVQVVSDASGNSVHFNNPLPPQSSALQAAVDSTHAVPMPSVRNPA